MVVGAFTCDSATPRCEGVRYVGNVAGFVGKLASKFNTVKMCPVHAPYKKSKSRQLLCVTKERPAEPHRARSQAQRGASSLHFS
jgi:hypothetical protein